jgi:ubiquinone/menaquinone biosynthesis C-methylase UbiE
MSSIVTPQEDVAAQAYQKTRIDHWNENARLTAARGGTGRYYHRRLSEVFRFIIPAGSRVLELGCGRGNLLASLEPSYGVGVDFSPEMVQQARQRHPNLTFVEADALELPVEEKFDFVILSDLVNDVWDVQRVFERMRQVCTPNTRIILNFYSRLWEWPRAIATKMGAANAILKQNWMTVEDVENLLYLSGFDVMRTWPEVIWPMRLPGVDAFFNKFVARFWPFKHLALTNFMLARPQPDPRAADAKPTVSVIVAARNEEGNIANIFRRTPELGGGTELIFVEGGSSDNTYAAIEKTIADNPQQNVKLFKQTGKGKGDAVRKGFAEATGDILMILDADLTVPPEDLPRFYDAIATGKGDFINGVRLVYPMEDQAMRMANLIGNKFFSMAFSWLIGQSVKDTLCGTKVLRRKDYERLAANRAYFGDFDPFGDFDLLFGAAKLNLKIVDLPVRYRERVYGTTNIQRWRHGFLLLQMVVFAARKMKFV